MWRAVVLQKRRDGASGFLQHSRANRLSCRTVQKIPNEGKEGISNQNRTDASSSCTLQLPKPWLWHHICHGSALLPPFLPQPSLEEKIVYFKISDNVGNQRRMLHPCLQPFESCGQSQFPVLQLHHCFICGWLAHSVLKLY